MGKFIDLTGKRFGRLQVVGQAENKNNRVMWKCKCDCGNEVIKRADNITNMKVASCGCWTKERKSELALADFSGKKFGKLKVNRLVEVKDGISYWECTCDCGNVGIFSSKSLYKRKSCGCVKNGWKIENKENMLKHGYCFHKAYSIWSNMIARCENPNCKEYKYYGARGILVCEEWKNVKSFCEWADNSGFSEGLTIERIDVNGNYEPNNCKWIERKEQAWNKRNTIKIFYEGKEISLAKLCNQLGLNYAVVRDRWYRGIKDNERLLYNGDLRDLRKENK